jgi:hypothetical protein
MSVISETGITYVELERALDRCMKQHPPSAPGFIMHPDANAMGGLFAAMLLQERPAGVLLQHLSAQVDQVKPAVLEAFGRWRVPD